MPKAKVNGINMYYEVHGDGDPVVLIVGLGGNHLFWAPLIPIWAAKHQLLIFDWRGMGDSDDGPEAEYSTQLLAADVAELMKQVGIGPAHVLGRSMGGCIAQYLAINHPEQVRSLVLASTFGRPDGFLVQLLDSWTRMVDSGGDPILIDQATFWGLPRHTFEPEFAEVSNAVLDVAHAGIKLSNRPAEFRKLSKAAQAHNALSDLHRISAPSMVMVGRDDILTPPSLAAELYDLIPGAELMFFERAGHAFYEQLPEKFASAALRFWATAKAEAAVKPEPVSAFSS
jgi:pimeloyl-ACP methyl ester carboxylesterase